MREKLSYNSGMPQSVKEYNDSYEITLDGWSCSLSKEHGIVPTTKSQIEVYGDIGRPIQGICVDGKTAFFKGSVQLDNDHKEWCRKREIEQRADFEKNKQELDADFDSLPDVFQKRLQILRENNPNFRWQHESYEMSCCVDAVKIAKTLKMVEELKRFQELDYKEQKKLVDFFDGHSGNSFGMVCRLAYWFLSKPENVWKEHGALCPLVGCKDYGCNVSKGRDK